MARPLLQRDQYPLVFSAPGKVIAFGEHAVVHGKPAIASAISLRAYLFVNLKPEPAKDDVTLNFPDLALHHTWKISHLPWSSAKGCHNVEHPGKTLDEGLLNALQPFLHGISPQLPDPVRAKHRKAALVFLYFYLSFGTPQHGCEYLCRSSIPPSAGLGSSASVSVCLATALLYQCQHISPPSPSGLGRPDLSRHALSTINDWAFLGETMLHGTPSGVDNAVATYGRAVYFQRRRAPDANILEPLDFPLLPLIITDTKQERSTAEKVAHVRELAAKHPGIVEPVLTAIGAITGKARKLIETHLTPSDNPIFSQGLCDLGELMRMNQDLLSCLGVSHPRIDQVRLIMDRYDVGWTKLTGAGGGGCTITLTNPAVSKENKATAERELKQNGFDDHEAELGDVGVGVLEIGRLESEKSSVQSVVEEVAFGSVPFDIKSVEHKLGFRSSQSDTSWRFWAEHGLAKMIMSMSMRKKMGYD